VLEVEDEEPALETRLALESNGVTGAFTGGRRTEIQGGLGREIGRLIVAGNVVLNGSVLVNVENVAI
jgi:hypothetical protein